MPYPKLVTGVTTFLGLKVGRTVLIRLFDTSRSETRGVTPRRGFSPIQLSH
jgi:hypothetical protein